MKKIIDLSLSGLVHTLLEKVKKDQSPVILDFRFTENSITNRMITSFSKIFVFKMFSVHGKTKNPALSNSSGLKDAFENCSLIVTD